MFSVDEVHNFSCLYSPKRREFVGPSLAAVATDYLRSKCGTQDNELRREFFCKCKQTQAL